MKHGFKLLCFGWFVLSVWQLSAADYALTSSAATQANLTAPVNQGAINVGILQLSITISKITNGGSCVGANVTSVIFSTIGTPGTTNTSDLIRAQLWYTNTNSTFTSPVLRGTINLPAGNMPFTIGDNYCVAGTYYYWLTYDLSVSAQPGNLIDAKVNASGISVTQYNGSQLFTPSFADPGGSRAIVCNFPLPTPTPANLLPMPMFARPTLGSHMANTGVSMVLQGDGVVYGAGSDQNGEMGDGVVGNPNMTGNQWVKVPIDNVKQISQGWSTVLALKTDGTVWGWGDNWFGKVGSGNGNANVTPPEQTIKASGGPLTNVVKVLASHQNAMAMTSDHRIFAWGRNNAGAFGAPHIPNFYYTSALPVYDDGVNLIDWAIDFGIGDAYSLFLRWDGTVWSMGNGQFGQLGNGVVYGPGGGSATPTPLLAPGGCSILNNVVSISAGRRHAFAITSNGDLYGWGLNNYGQTGTGAGPNVVAPKRVLGPGCTGYLTNIVQVMATGNNGYAVNSTGHLFAWGSDQSGQLGDGSPPDLNTPCPKLVDINVVEITGSLNTAILRKTDGCIYGAGNNWYGSLGGPLPASCCGYVKSFTATNLVSPCAVVLPVELLHFSGKRQDKQIRLEWSTSSETNNDYFIVGKIMSDGSSKLVGRVTGSGTTSSTSEYFLLDTSPMEETNVYWLTQHDFNGKSENLGSIAVKYTGENEINIIHLNSNHILVHSNKKVNAVIDLFDVTGRLVYTSIVHLSAGENMVPIGNLNLNLVIVKIATAEHVFNQKIATIY